jgi:biotin transport system permease protein
MTGTYLAKRTWLHRVPAGLKLAVLAGVTVAVVPLSDWCVFACLMLTLALLASLGSAAVRRLALLKPLLPLVAVIGIIEGVANGTEAAAVTLARIGTMVLLADLVTMTTTMNALMGALAPIFRPLRFVGLRPRSMTLSVALVLRFVPVLLAGWRAREEAWRARSRRRIPLHLLTLYLADALRLADQVADALDARGFDTRDGAPARRIAGTATERDDALAQHG